MYLGTSGFVLIIIIIFLIMLVFKCCLERNSTKITKRKHRRTSYQDIYKSLTLSSQAALQPLQQTTTAPPFRIHLELENESRTSNILEIPEVNEASPVVVPPYPVDPRHPTPHTGPPAPGFATHNPPYPTHTLHPVPAPVYYPPPMGAAPYPPMSGHTPYPPATAASPYPPAGPPIGGSAPYPDYSAQPPSYSEAVSQPPAQPLPSKEVYSKQAPYNPNY